MDGDIWQWNFRTNEIKFKNRLDRRMLWFYKLMNLFTFDILIQLHFRYALQFLGVEDASPEQSLKKV